MIKNGSIPNGDSVVTIIKVEFPKLWLRPKRQEEEFLNMQRDIADIIKNDSLKRLEEMSCGTLCLLQHSNVGLAI